MRILMPVPQAWPWTGGMETHVRALAGALTAAGHEVHVWAPCDPHDPRPLPDCDPDTGTHLRFFPQPISGLWAIPPRSLIRAVRIQARDFDVVHTHLLHKPVAVLVARALRDTTVPLIVTGHWHGGGHSTLARIAHRLYQPWARRALRRANAFVAVSPAEARQLAADFPHSIGRTTVIPNGIIPVPDAQPMPVAPEQQTLLSVGRLEPYKRVDHLIRVLPHLPTHIHLAVVGPGDIAPLQDLATSLGCADRVHLLGPVADADLARWWATADVFCTVSAHEAFGLTLGEALSAGLPVVASDLPAHRDVAELAGNPAHIVWCDPENREELTTAITRALTLPRQSKVLVAAWAATADSTATLYAHLLAPTASG